MTEDEVAEAQRHVRWQVLIDPSLDRWANLPAFMTAALDHCYAELEERPIRFTQFWTFEFIEFRVHPVPTMTNLIYGTVTRMQRVVLLRIP